MKKYLINYSKFELMKMKKQNLKRINLQEIKKGDTLLVVRKKKILLWTKILK